MRFAAFVDSRTANPRLVCRKSVLVNRPLKRGLARYPGPLRENEMWTNSARQTWRRFIDCLLLNLQRRCRTGSGDRTFRPRLELLEARITPTAIITSLASFNASASGSGVIIDGSGDLFGSFINGGAYGD